MKLLLKGLFAVYLVAFASLWMQLEGLIGNDGIHPARDYLQQIGTSFTLWEKILFFPTLQWIHNEPLTLHLTSGLGAISALLGIFGIFQRAGFLIAWICYLSLTVAAGPFTGYQWDALLLEAGFLGFLTTFIPRWSRLGRWLFRLLLFRLMFMSGLAKILSGDPAWLDGTALSYHFETQPLPTLLAWHLHLLPENTMKFFTFLTLAVELVVPFFIFMGRKFQRAALWIFIGLQLLILMSGNYGFFNLLALVLCLSLRPPRWIAAVDGAGLRSFYAPMPVRLTVYVLLLCGLFEMTFLPPPDWKPVRIFLQTVQSYRLVNPYGLFAVMTTTRDEIEVQGSTDGKEWKPYAFHWKPGPVNEAPGIVQPHMPRLDWQMWFAALATFERQPWFQNFLLRLLQGSKPTLALLKSNPFLDSPPRYVRARRYRYTFTNFQQRSQIGAWWTRIDAGPYSPPVSLSK